jgi:hypothetical protein
LLKTAFFQRESKFAAGSWRIFPDRTEVQRRRVGMLWTIAVILLVLWLIGWLGFHILGGFIHILIVLAVVAVILQLVRGV